MICHRTTQLKKIATVTRPLSWWERDHCMANFQGLRPFSAIWVSMPLNTNLQRNRDDNLHNIHKKTIHFLKKSINLEIRRVIWHKVIIFNYFMAISIMVINKRFSFISKFRTFKNVMMLVFQFLSGIYITDFSDIFFHLCSSTGTLCFLDRNSIVSLSSKMSK